MPEITKETFLKAEDPKNRDAMLFDMLKSIDEKVSASLKLRDTIKKCERQLGYVMKGIGVTITAICTGAIAWFVQHS